MISGYLLAGDVLVMTVAASINKWSSSYTQFNLRYESVWLFISSYFLGSLTRIYDVAQYRSYLEGIVQQKLESESKSNS